MLDSDNNWELGLLLPDQNFFHFRTFSYPIPVSFGADLIMIARVKAPATEFIFKVVFNFSPSLSFLGIRLCEVPVKDQITSGALKIYNPLLSSWTRW